MSGYRRTLLILATIAVLAGIAAVATNFIEDEVGWNTAFSVIQTLVVAALMVFVTRDAGSSTVK